MTKQWHNTKIQKKPCNRYNPSLKQKIGSAYRPWFLVVTFLSFFISIALIGCAAQVKVLNDDVSDEVFHLWIGIPLLCFAIFALICFVVRKKRLIVVFLIFAIIIMVLCGVGALVGGVRYWMDGWQRVKHAMDNDKCALKNGACACTNIPTMPTSMDDCDDLKTVINLIIAEFALSAAGFVASVIGVYLSFMAICCGPWLYMEWYDETHDPDFGGKDNVRHVSGNVNQSYGGPYTASNY